MRYNEIQFELIENNSLGFSKEQIIYIKSLIKKYMTEYTQITLQYVCDYFSWDYGQNEFNEYTYTHNKEGVKYTEYDALAQYNDEDKLIGFNHIRMSKMELENDDIVHRIKKDKQKFEEIKKKYEALKKTSRSVRRKNPTFDELFNTINDDELKDHGIDAKIITEEYFDVMLIRIIEEYGVIKRIVAHEIGHAIACSYDLEKDDIIKSLYEKFKDGFEDLQEFIAECFMASELTDEISLANAVKQRILLHRDLA